MADTRTLREKLAAMASQDVSPNEAAIAKAKLQEMGADDREPPRRPPDDPRYSTATTGWVRTDTTAGTTWRINTADWTFSGYSSPRGTGS